MKHVVALARTLAHKAHQYQKRKFTGEPYITHPEAVAQIVLDHGGDDDMVAAALLHDTIEDTWVTYALIERECNERVANMVRDCTKIFDHDDDVEERQTNERLANATADSQTIKLADILHNLSNVEARSKRFAKKAFAEKRRVLPLLKKGDPVLYGRVAGLIIDYYARNA